VVPLYEVIDDPESAKLYLVMKYVDQGPIAKVGPDNTCAAIGAARAKEVMGELVAGLSYLHKRGVAHRDIKPDNILVDAAGTPYFADFGVSTIIDKDDPTLSTVEGTALFMPPELFSESRLKVDAFAADVWSLGVTLFMLLFGTAPFGGSNYREIAEAVRSRELVFPATAGAAAVGEEWEDLLRGMLRKDPARRLTLKHIKKHRALVDDDFVTADEVTMAMSCVRGFLPREDDSTTTTGRRAVQASFSRSVQRISAMGVPRCARKGSKESVSRRIADTQMKNRSAAVPSSDALHKGFRALAHAAASFADSRDGSSLDAVHTCSRGSACLPTCGDDREPTWTGGCHSWSLSSVTTPLFS
jgi:serine/threonine protein kinase